MAIFGSARRRFLDRFEPRHDGFAYRSIAYAPAVLVTVEERDWLIHDDGDRRELIQVLMFATPVAAILAGFLAYAVFPSPAVVAATVCLSLIGFPLLLVLWGSAGRRRLLRRRPHIDEGLPWDEIERRRLKDMPWFMLVLSAATTLLWCWTVVGSGNLHPAWRVLAGVVGALAFGFSIRECRLKFKHGRQSWPSDVGR